uniref:peptidase U32 family protein n=1 Tax=Helicobacter rodentium TaxID=59617 RepID=UPI003F4AD340
MIKPELLMPAGNVEKLKYAVKYGADAVYLGVVDFSLRAMRKGELITLDNLKFAIDTAREMGAKAYLTLNIFAFNNDIKLLESAMDKIV